MFRLEDVAMGIWIADLKKEGLEVRYENEPRVYNEGCRDGYVVAHYQGPREMLCLWQKLQQSKRAFCCGDSTWAQHDPFVSPSAIDFRSDLGYDFLKDRLVVGVGLGNNPYTLSITYVGLHIYVWRHYWNPFPPSLLSWARVWLFICSLYHIEFMKFRRELHVLLICSVQS